MKLDIKISGWLGVMLAMVFLCTGCGTTGKHVRWYEGPAMSADKVALLKIERNPWTVILTVDKIDGTPLVRKHFIENNTAEIELLPGQHDLEVSYQDSNRYSSKEDAKISFAAEAGKNYQLLGAPGERTFSKALHQELTFHDWYWMLWIVDAESKKVVAGKARETPMHWYE